MKKYKPILLDFKLIILAFLILTVSYSCQKIDKDIPETPDSEVSNSMNDIVVPDGFQWQTTTNYNFYISGALDNVVKITSEDETIVYHKGTYIENNGDYNVSLRLPTFLVSVKINSESVDLGGSSVFYDLSTKATLANYALSFDGSDDFVALNSTTFGNFGIADFTVEGWMKATNSYDFKRYLLGKREFSGATAPLWNIFINASGTLGFEIKEIGSTNSGDVTATTDVGDGNWHHFAVTRSGTTTTIYINGVQENQETTTSFPGGTTNLSNTTSFKLGKAFDPAATYKGQLDEIRVWSTARSAGQISANYDILVSPSSPGLVAYYRMNENTGTTVGDETSNNYDGIINNNVSWVPYVNGFDSDGDGVDDKDDDYWDDALRAHDNYYPAADTGTVAFEDLWPGTGDYDFNDLLIGYQFKTVTNAANQVTEIYSYFEVRAHGAQLDNGFGFQLPNADASILSEVVVTGYSHTTGLITIDGTSHFESGQTNPVVIVMDKVADLMGKFENTDNWKPTIPFAPITITMTVTDPPVSNFLAADFDMENWDPFMFIDQTRGYEIHKIDVAPTDLMNPAYFGTFEDASVPGNGEYYRSIIGLPWVLEFQTTFEYPFEKSDLTYAYLHFREWAESAGTLYTDWYSNENVGYRNTNHIYN